MAAVIPCLISGLSAQNAPDAPLELKGTQTERIVTLKKARAPHTIVADYVVPEGFELNIDPGTHITFSKNSGLSVQGKLNISGNPEAIVVFAGRGTGSASWNGININGASSATISNTRITGANVAIGIYASNSLLESVHMHGNTVGIRIGEYGSRGDATVRNCLITQNKENGVYIIGSTGTFENCTIDRNGGWGIRGDYSASAKLSSCRITRNKQGGIWCQLYNCRVEARNSMIIDNGRYDLVNDTPANWDLSGNWWGATATAVLKKKGDTANLAAIKDGRDREQAGVGQVSLASFLDAEPAGIGSTIISGPSAQNAPDAPLELKGTQIEPIVTLKKAKVPHTIIADYVVPEGCELNIEEGTHIAFLSKNSGLSVQGKLNIDGTPEAVVVFAGRGTGPASWNGITINRSSSTTISNMRITRANVAINIIGSNPLLEGVYMDDNTVGIRIGEGSDPTVRNCLITNNRGDGVQIFASTGTFINCTIDSNARWGIRGELNASPKLSSCRITRNKHGGVWCKLAGCKVEAHNSMIIDNGRYDLVNDSPEMWDFSGNWWGAAATSVLKKKDVTANLDTIKDGRDRGQAGIGHVSLDSFLEAEPEAIGSTIKPK